MLKIEHKKYLDKIRKSAGKTINQHNLISENDKILVAISGGRDSLVLLDILSERLSYLPIKYNLVAIHIIVEDMPVRADIEYLKEYCDRRNTKLVIENVHSGIEKRGDKSACFVCSWNKRKKIFDKAAEFGCNKVAFGHHMDDALETLLMNMTYHGEISSIPPKINMFSGEFKLIRPLIELTDGTIKKYAQILDVKNVEGGCPFDKDNKREIFREMINQLSSVNENARKNIFKSMSKIAFDYLPSVKDSSRQPEKLRKS